MDGSIMTPPDDLTEAMREALERVPDDLRGVAGGFFHPTSDHRELERLGLIEECGYGSWGGGLVCRYVRTPAGRSILAKGLGK